MMNGFEETRIESLASLLTAENTDTQSLKQKQAFHPGNIGHVQPDTQPETDPKDIWNEQEIDTCEAQDPRECPEYLK
jgi:hypothetical protein